MAMIKTSELTGAALDWAVKKCHGLPERDAKPASDDDLEGATLPITLYEVVTLGNEIELLEVRIAPIKVIRHGIDEKAGATAPSITAIDERGDRFLGSVRDYYLSREEAELECARILAQSQVNGSPSTDWAVGGPIIEREGIEMLCNVSATEAKRFKDAHADWFACMKTSKHSHWHGRTPLIAAMRCFVASKMGDTIEVPNKLS